jgi:hypothetical protein
VPRPAGGPARRRPGPAFTAGAAVGVLGGLVGLGGAEFRLPRLIACSGSPPCRRSSSTRPRALLAAGGLLLGAVPEVALVPLVVVLLLVSAVRVRRHA